MTHDIGTFDELAKLVRDIYQEPEAFIPLHEPRFPGREQEYVADAIESTFVSSVGAYVDRFEAELARVVGAPHAVATVNGTAALHTAMLVVGVRPGELVLTQPLTFVATANAIDYTGAKPVFLDVDDSMGLCPVALEEFLTTHCEAGPDGTVLTEGGERIAACVPMHTFGFPTQIEEIARICEAASIPLVEDAAESVGSKVGERACGTYGAVAAISLNGNKVITSGGGGAVLTSDEGIARAAKHLTTTAKVPHSWEYVHDRIGYNYRMPNLNAALACAQLESLPTFLAAKREVTERYETFFADSDLTLQTERPGTTANYWLNTVVTPDRETRDAMLARLNELNVMARPAWQLMHDLPMFDNLPGVETPRARWFAERVVNIPSSVPLHAL